MTCRVLCAVLFSALAASLLWGLYWLWVLTISMPGALWRWNG